MKRAMSDNSNMCTKCSKLFHKGWQMFHHKKICKGIRERSSSVPTNQEVGQHDKEPQVEQDQDEGVHEDRDPGAALDLPLTTPAIVPVTELPMLRNRSALSTQTREILTFLATAEKGEGCSREQAQAWLDYTHAKGGPAANLLPKDIRTCWKHVARV
jgi:hypothetical protein